MKVGDVEITKADEQAMSACIRRRKTDGVCVADLRALLSKRLSERRGLRPWRDPEADRAVSEAVPRLLAKWKSEQLIDNPVRGRWVWVGTQGGAGPKRRKGGK